MPCVIYKNNKGEIEINTDPSFTKERDTNVSNASTQMYQMLINPNKEDLRGGSSGGSKRTPTREEEGKAGRGERKE